MAVLKEKLCQDNLQSLTMKKKVLLLLLLSAKLSTGSSTHPYSTEPTGTTCGNTCINGDDAGTCPFNCSCEVNGTEFFTGRMCEVVLFNDDIISSKTSVRTANFTWESAPNIAEEEYKFVYKKTDDNDNETYVSDFEMITDVTARLTELEAGEVRYTVCVANVSATYIDFSDNNTCLSIRTEEGVIDWAFTIAAIVVGVGVILAVVVLITLRLILDGIQNRKESRKKKGYSTVGVKKKAKEKAKNIESDTQKPKKKGADKAAKADEVLGYTNSSPIHEDEDTDGELKHSMKDGIEKGRDTGLLNGSYHVSEVYEDLDAGDHSLYGDSYTGGSKRKKRSNEIQRAQFSQRKPTDSETPTYSYEGGYKTGVKHSMKDQKGFRSQPEWDKHSIDLEPDYMEQRPQHHYYHYNHSSRYQERYSLDRDEAGRHESRGYFDLSGSDLHVPKESSDNYSLPEPDY